MAAHVIHSYGPITSQSVEHLRNACLSAIQEGAASEVHLRLSSDGGNLTAGFTAYHFLASLPVHLTVHNISNVESVAVLVYLAGAVRLTVPHGRFMLHALHWSFGAGTVDHDRLIEYKDSLDFDAERYARIFEERTQSAEERVDVRAALDGRAHILDSGQAVRGGVASRVAGVETPAKAVHWWPPVVKA